MPHSGGQSAEPADEAGRSEVELLVSPAEPVGPIVETGALLASAITGLASGVGPVAVDAERAQGFRYSAKAYLFQFRRAGAGTFLLDPISFEDNTGRTDLSELGRAIEDAEWVIHAASQDLPCLVTDALVPRRIFDTELAARLLGLPRVGLGPLVEHFFGRRLLKEHSAADWSSRPLPQEWIDYAALDVELLLELRDLLEDALAEAGKADWAAQEFAFLVARAQEPAAPVSDRWRRTSGLHRVRTQVGAAIVRELWQARDEIAAQMDRAPGKILPDQAITELAARATRGGEVPDRTALRTIDGFKRRNARRFEGTWVTALDRVRAMEASEYPRLKLPVQGPPPPRAWESRDPDAWRRWQAVRPLVNDIAEAHSMPAENLLTPDFLRRLAWPPPTELTPASVSAALAACGARQWQQDLLAAPLAEALAAAT